MKTGIKLNRKIRVFNKMVLLFNLEQEQLNSFLEDIMLTILSNNKKNRKTNIIEIRTLISNIALSEDKFLSEIYPNVYIAENNKEPNKKIRYLCLDKYI